jgi:hypothetical protein
METFNEEESCCDEKEIKRKRAHGQGYQPPSLKALKNATERNRTHFKATTEYVMHNECTNGQKKFTMVDTDR